MFKALAVGIILLGFIVPGLIDRDTLAIVGRFLLGVLAGYTAADLWHKK